jgi:hypothetical protein
MSLPLHILSQLAGSSRPGLHVLRASASGALHSARVAWSAGVPNPAPASPGPGGGAVTTLRAWVKWLALAARLAADPSYPTAARDAAAGTAGTRRQLGLAAKGTPPPGMAVLLVPVMYQVRDVSAPAARAAGGDGGGCRG